MKVAVVVLYVNDVRACLAFWVDDLAAMRARLVDHGVPATEVAEYQGMQNFAFPDPEGRWFAVTR